MTGFLQANRSGAHIMSVTEYRAESVSVEASNVDREHNKVAAHAAAAALLNSLLASAELVAANSPEAAPSATTASDAVHGSAGTAPGRGCPSCLPLPLPPCHLEPLLGLPVLR